METMKLDEYVDNEINPFLHVENIIFDVAEPMVRSSSDYNNAVILIEDVSQALSHLLIESNGFENLPSDENIKAFAVKFWGEISSLSAKSHWWTRDNTTS
jgi:hypothetical protein